MNSPNLEGPTTRGRQRTLSAQLRRLGAARDAALDLGFTDLADQLRDADTAVHQEVLRIEDALRNPR